MAAATALGGAIELRGRLKLVQLLCVVLVVVSCSPQVVFGQLTVTSLPDALFQDNSGVHNVVEGSVIQLFCSVESLNVTFSWTKDGSPVVIDVPDLRERTCNDSTTTTSMLTIEDFQSSDNGTYQCMATSGQESGSGSSTTLTALATGGTVLIFNTQPSDNEQSYDTPVFRRDYRSGIMSGTTVDSTLLTCDVKRDGTSTSPNPTVQWIRNGELIENSTGSMTSLTIDSFSQADVGEYQCIYTDSDSDAEILTSIPYRLQTDIITFSMTSQRNENTVFLERISPEVIFLRPPEELVIEVRSTGRVIVVQWSVNGARISSSVLEGFANHREIYFRKETTSSDIGLYEVTIFPDNTIGQLLIPVELEFIVTSPVDAITTSTSGPVVAVLEGNTVTISCVSTGAPTPSITWELNGEVAPFVPSNVVEEFRAVLVRDSMNNLQPNVTLGRITSNLMIVNAQYPNHDGVYTCTGTNDAQMMSESSVSITVQVQVAPVVAVTASSQRVSIGATVTLSCIVNRTNPAVDTFVWVNEANSSTPVGTESNITVTFALTQDFGTYRCTVNNTAGLLGSDSVIIEQGFPPTVTTIDPPLPIVVDTEIELTCIVTGEDPPDTITWTFNGMVIFQGNEMTGGNFNLTISSDDYGSYTCTSSNEFGTNNSTIEVIQAVPPLLTPQAMDIEAVVGTPLSLTVNVTEFNLDIDSVMWTRNGSVIENGTDRYTITNIDLSAPPSMVILTRDNVTSPVEDSGDYSVNVTNPAGSNISTFNVTVTARPSIIDPSDDLTITLLEQMDDIVLNCTARGIPTPTIVWYRGPTQLTGNDRTTISTPVASTHAEGFYYVESTLTISPSNRGDSDVYYCEAENTVLGSSTTARRAFNVTVNFFVTIYVHPESDSVVAPDMVVLTCQADGEPVPDIVWIKESADGTMTEFNATTVTSTGNITIDENIDGLNKTSTLRIQPTSALDTANYTCRAQNNVGRLPSRTAQVTVYVTPTISSPQNGTIILVNVTNDVTVTCTASAVPAPMIQFYYNGTLLDRTDGATGIGGGIPMRVQIGDPSSPVSITDGTYKVSRDVTLFSTRDESLTGFECRAVNSIVDMDLNMTLSDTVDFGFIVQVPPNITMGPVTRTVVSPNNVSFSCIANGVPAPDVLWLRLNNNGMLESVGDAGAEEDELTIDSQVLEDSRTTVSSLNLFGVQPIFASNYTCRAVNLLGVDEAVAQLIVHVIPVVLEPVPETTVTVDESTPAEFMCSAAGIPEPVISWVRVLSNGSTIELTSDGDERVMLSNPVTDENFELDTDATSVPVFGDVIQVNRTLTLNNTMDSDSGTYRCVASNKAGNDTQDFELVVQVAPTFVVSPMDVTLTEGEDAMFTCTVTGRPRPSIMWAFIQQESCTTLPSTIQPLNEMSGDYTFERIEMGERELESTLTVTSTRPSDTGCYVCSADNEVVGREASANALLTVEVVPMIQRDTFLPNYTVNETETVTFECTATGIPAPNITWSRDGVELSDRVSVSNLTPTSYNRSDGEVVQIVTRTLSLASTVDGDSGTYTCDATNNAGMDSATFELIVQIAPNITDFTPSQQTVTSPVSAVFTCNATGRPRPSIQWYRVELEGGRTPLTGEDVNSGMRGISSTLTISNTDASDATDYVCVASNIVDSTEMTGSLIVYVVPVITFAADNGVYIVNGTFPVTFTCTATGIPPPTIEWRRNNDLILADTDSGGRFQLTNRTINMTRGMVSVVTRMLTISNTMDTDNGTYTCEANNTAVGGKDQEDFELYVQVPPTVTRADGRTNIEANRGDTLNLTFIISRADPLVLTDGIQWFYSRDFSMTPFRDSVEITGLMSPVSGNSTYSFSPDSQSLTIMDIQQALAVGEDTDGGRYFLVATNPAGTNYSFYDIIVNGPPVFSETPSNQFAINNGSNAVFVCYARASPLHQISWTFTNRTETSIISTVGNVSDSTKYSIIRERVNERIFGRLTIYDVRFSDRGTYTCNASNSIGSVTSAADLTVHVHPIIVRVSDDTDVVIDNSTYLVCLATGFPIPSITWLKDGAPINLYSDVSLNMRIDIFEFDSRNESDVSSGFMGSGSVEEFLNKSTGINSNEIARLGNLGVVSFLRFYDVVREDTAMYSCVAANELPETTRLTNTSDPVQLTVLEPPDAPVDVIVINNGARWVNISWSIFFNGNRAVFGVYISAYALGFHIQFHAEIMKTSYNVTELLPFTNYTFGVVACNEIGCSTQSELSEPIRTLNDTASPPQSVSSVVSAGEEGETSITVSWTEPLMPNGIISDYQITAEGTKQYNSNFNDVKTITVSAVLATTGSGLQTALAGLTPGTDYSIRVAAINGAGTGESSMPITATTNNADPIAPTVQPVVGAAVDNNVRTISVNFPRFDETNGQISHYQVAVVILPKGTGISDLEDPDTEFPNINGEAYGETFCDRDFSSPFVYVTAEFARDLLPSDGQFVIGLADQPNDRSIYTNGLLCFSKSYTFFLRAYTFANPSSSNQRRAVRQADQRQYTIFSSTAYTPVSNIPDSPASSAPIIAGVIVGVLLLAAIIVVIIIVAIIVRRRSVKVYNPRQFGRDMYDHNDGFKLTDYSTNATDEGVVTHQPVPVASLAAHVERMHLNENCGFSEEYKVIQERSAQHTVDACTLPDNKPRNRYANIQCYDHSRVHLTPIEGAEHDYINSNFIPGYNREKEYIASQGPLPDTVGDFWRLVWDYNIPTVVMLTNLMEKMKVKCSQYWPSSGSQQYSNFTITLINSVQQADFVIRHFQIKPVNSEEVREVRQYHFTSWPDFGVPRHATPLLYFLRRIRNAHPYSNEKPILVHCSAGVGRTGSLITIDVELQRARQKQMIDSFNFVLQMRDKRNHMVQTEGQYVFLHDAILEGYTSGDTEIMVGKLGKRMTELEAVDDEGISGFRKEFERLREFKVNVREFTDANDDANKFKNRIANALPYNYNRVHLKMSPGVGGSDYINASFIDGYAHKMTYIATQGPLRNTIEDFWKLIWERESGVIVMLTQLEEKGKEQCAQYWPHTTDCPEKIGSQFSVEMLSEGAFEDYVCRELKITDITSTDNKCRVIKQFHFTAWPESGAPSTGAGMIDLIDQVIRTQQHTGNKPIIVHCSAGIGRTGAFCALSTAIERVKAEGIVDVFHTVKHLRTQRPHMVQTVEQYAFCYYAIKEYLESLSNYSNFDY